jgi:hypothetical protein
MSVANPLWGAPRIHGELLRLGIDVGQTTVAKYMARTRPPPSQGWKTFLRNHADGIASMDLFVVPTISFRLLYGFLILQHSRRKLLWLDVTESDCPSTDRTLRLATDATIYRSRSRLRLWQGCHPTASSNGYTGSADLATVALAKRILGEAHRLDPTGLS